MDLLSRLLLQPESGATPVPANAADFGFAEITQKEFDDLAALASSNHVIMRAIQAFAQIAKDSGDSVRAGWAGNGARDRVCANRQCDLVFAENLRRLRIRRLRRNRH